MKIFFHNNFKKKYKKLRPSEKQKFKQRSLLFLQNPFDPVLRNHPLGGRYEGFRSINITGDLRVLYQDLGRQEALFITIDTHSNLYK